MRLIFTFLFHNTFAYPSHPEIKICSWNLFDFGKTKSYSEIEFIAQTVNDYDIVLIQEVVAKDPGGAQAVGRLGEALNRKGTKWEYRISDPTSGENSFKKERYAFLWKPSKVSLIGRPWLEQKYNLEIDREPFYATFQAGDKTFTLVNFHAITKSMQPETEVKYFKFLPAAYPDLNLIFCGDFNLPQSHTVFNPLKAMGYAPILQNQKQASGKPVWAMIAWHRSLITFFISRERCCLFLQALFIFIDPFQPCSKRGKFQIMCRCFLFSGLNEVFTQSPLHQLFCEKTPGSHMPPRTCINRSVTRAICRFLKTNSAFPI